MTSSYSSPVRLPEPGPGNVWDADVTLSQMEAASLIDRQFPELAPAQLESWGEGWDNWAYLVNGQYVFRFPRRQIGAALIERELRSLPHFGPYLPEPVPAPRFVGFPAGNYPYPFMGYPMLAGVTACRMEWTEELRAINAVPLARFLAVLHSIPVDADTLRWAPTDEIERANIRKRAPMLIERLRRVSSKVNDIDIGGLIDLVERLYATIPYDGPICWVHGDLYARHLLVDERHRLCGVIDWGDVHLGDPALDISIAISFLPPSARTAFRKAYGPIDDATWDRARFKAIHYGPPLIDYGLDVGDEAMRAAGEYALRSALLKE
jgi:aminoglycoside phosphotransferase (APT) family kinase protein